MISRFLHNVLSVKKPYPTKSRNIDLGDLKRVTPLYDLRKGDSSRIDAYYLKDFISQEVSKSGSKILFSGSNVYSDYLKQDKNINPDNLPFEGEEKFLSNLVNLPAESFDCIILIQILHMVYNLKTIIKTLNDLLKPNGVLYATFPGTCHHHCWEEDFTAYRVFTRISLTKIFEENFISKSIKIKTYGNVLTAAALLHGVPAAELTFKELKTVDKQYPVIITVKAFKPEN